MDWADLNFIPHCPAIKGAAEDISVVRQDDCENKDIISPSQTSPKIIRMQKKLLGYKNTLQLKPLNPIIRALLTSAEQNASENARLLIDTTEKIVERRFANRPTRIKD